jgi:hypothetical protein
MHPGQDTIEYDEYMRLHNTHSWIVGNSICCEKCLVGKSDPAARHRCVGGILKREYERVY